MNNRALAIGLVVAAIAIECRAADIADSASCEEMTSADQCRIGWNFSRRVDSYYLVQQFDPIGANWRTVATLPKGTPNRGRYETPVEAAYLYRVLACDDVQERKDCSGSTMVWAPFVQPEESVHLIPSRVPLVKKDIADGTPLNAVVNKEGEWLTQVIQYNVYLMVNAIARANIADLPEMTPVKDIRETTPDDPIEQVQFNVYWAYSAERGAPIDTPEPEPEVRPPHEHPRSHPIGTPENPGGEI